MPNLCRIPSPLLSVPLPRDCGWIIPFSAPPQAMLAGSGWQGHLFPGRRSVHSSNSALQLTSRKTTCQLSPPARSWHFGFMYFPDPLEDADSRTYRSPPGRESWTPITASSGNTGPSVPTLTHVIQPAPPVLQKDLAAATGKTCTSLEAGAEGKLTCHLLP